MYIVAIKLCNGEWFPLAGFRFKFDAEEFLSKEEPHGAIVYF